MTGENVQRLAAFLLSARFDAMPQHVLVSGFMHPFLESEAAALFGLLQGPSGEDTGDLSNIFLGIAAVHTERVEFQQFAAIVLIQAAALAFGLLHRGGTALPGRPAPVVIVVALWDAVGEIRIRSYAQPVVEIEEHGRTLRCRHQQVLKLTHGVRTDHVALVAGEQVAVGSFPNEHIEVIEPEIGHHFFQLAVAVNGTQQFALHQFAGYDLLRIVERHESLALLRLHPLHEFVALVTLE